MDISKYIAEKFCIDKKIIDLIEECESEILPDFDNVKKIAEFNQYKVIDAFKNNNISTRHFSPSTGYGYSDEGRERLCSVYADAFGAEDAIVSPLLMSGTHAISMALFGLMRPGDEMLCISGQPYDTFLDVIYSEKNFGSLKEWGIECSAIPLTDGKIDTGKVIDTLKQNDKIKVLHVQKSRGYEPRPCLSAFDIKEAAKEIKSQFPDVVIFTDNCYGEFTETIEPIGDACDVIAGSLIKNAGGGFAPTGGYIAGRSDLIEKINHRFCAPGLGGEIGSYAGSYLPYYQGLFMAPHTVSQAMMGVMLMAKVSEKLGYSVVPTSEEKRYDITQSIIFNDKDKMIAFIRGIQKSSAIDGNVVPYPWDMPGYNDQVIMAAGTFVQGSSIELSADGPIRPPYAVYVQGALTYEHAKLGTMYALSEIKDSIGELF